MTTLRKQALIPYTPAEIFALVNDVESYPQFLPWCGGARVLSAEKDEVRAQIEISKGAVRKNFSTINRIQQDKMIEMRLLNGPFRHLEGYWRFDPIGEQGCRISFDIEFEFSNRLVGMTVGPVFQHIVKTFVDAFCKRAIEVYGRR